MFCNALLYEKLLSTRLKLSFVLLSNVDVKLWVTFRRNAFPYSSEPTLYWAYGPPNAAPEKSASSVQFTLKYICVLLFRL